VHGIVLEAVLPVDLNPSLVSVLTQRIEKQKYVIYTKKIIQFLQYISWKVILYYCPCASSLSADLMEYFLLLVVGTKQVSLLPRADISRREAGVNELNMATYMWLEAMEPGPYPLHLAVAFIRADLKSFPHYTEQSLPIAWEKQFLFDVLSLTR
jgi:hypothetical protein